ncbi:hypothetical protein ACFYXD_35430 [Streptomyces platensis]|uniref:hypothetical protein n=1 Tax=Streptomyces platensis TaxID=58346 RepID=UPI00368BCC91
MTDTTAQDIDEDIDATPETLRTDLAQLYVRTTATPTPRHPAALGWQMTAATLSALSSRLLEVVERTAPAEAAQIAEWFAGPFGDGPDLEEHTYWVGERVAGDLGVFHKWLDEAREMALQAKAVTEAFDQAAAE